VRKFLAPFSPRKKTEKLLDSRTPAGVSHRREILGFQKIQFLPLSDEAHFHLLVLEGKKYTFATPRTHYVLAPKNGAGGGGGKKGRRTEKNRK
jgi:hypothetical protein